MRILFVVSLDSLDTLANCRGSRASVLRLKETAEKFSGLGVTSLLLTKLDEAASLGSLLALSQAAQLPLSYLTTGQNVPDDIEPADEHRLARLILGQEQLGA